MNILCFGDSNTFGYIPGGGGRYDRRKRWPKKLQKLLGEEYQIIEEGLCGRTTVFEDMTVQGRSGLDAIEKAIELHRPVDLLIVMLGTNDCKIQFGTTPEKIADGLLQVIKKAKSNSANPFKVLIIAPAPLKEVVATGDFGHDFDQNSVEISKRLVGEFEKLAIDNGWAFLDASKVTEVSDVDGVHLDKEGHRALAETVKNEILRIC